MRIIFLRHAETDFNKLGLSQGGDVDPEINEIGKKQALCTAKFLKENYNISQIYSSTMVRAKNTTEIISNFIEFQKEIYFNEKLKESSKKIMGEKDYNGLTKEEYKKIIGERVRKIFDFIVENNDFDSDILVVSHGAVIKNLIRNIYGIKEIETNVVTDVGNCTLTIFSVKESEIKLEKSYDNSHLNGI